MPRALRQKKSCVQIDGRECAHVVNSRSLFYAVNYAISDGCMRFASELVQDQAHRASMRHDEHRTAAIEVAMQCTFHSCDHEWRVLGTRRHHVARLPRVPMFRKTRFAFEARESFERTEAALAEIG